MSDVSLVPVDHQPDFEDASLVPVDHDPFAPSGAEEMIGQAKVQLASQAQRAPTYDNAEADAAAMSPETYVNPLVQRILGNLATLPQRAIDASIADVQHLGEEGYTPQSVGPAVETALMMMGGSSAVPAAANELRAGIKLWTPRSPASRAAEKGFSGIGTTPNGGATFAGTDHLYSAGPGQRSIVEIPLTGSRRADNKLANKWGGFTQTPSGYMWHHVDDFNPQNGKSSFELVDENAHKATLPHAGSVSQYEKFHGIPYKR